MVEQSANSSLHGRPGTLPIRVLVVDDSPALCRFFDKALSSDPGLVVLGVAHDAFDARDKIKQLKPDVLTLDIDMPKMNGLTFLSNLMRLRPMPVIVVTSLSDGDDEIARTARQRGAFEILSKPQYHQAQLADTFASQFIDLIKRASRDWQPGVVHAGQPTRAEVSAPRAPVGTQPEIRQLIRRYSSTRQATRSIRRLLAFGASTGGPEALCTAISQLNAPDCTVLVAQHMPVRFMVSLARRLNTHTRFTAKIAEQDEPLEPGHAYLAPGDQHLRVQRHRDALICQLLSTEPVSGQRPSVDELFNSLATSAGACTIAALLTGMGSDGAAGLLNLHRQGAPTIVQNKRSSVVWGMPGKAVELDAADANLEICDIGPAMMSLLAVGQPGAR